jgi:hypothetical protein
MDPIHSVFSVVISLYEFKICSTVGQCAKGLRMGGKSPMFFLGPHSSCGSPDRGLQNSTMDNPGISQSVTSERQQEQDSGLGD